MLLNTEPRASRTARLVKFSDAMRTRDDRCRAFSLSMSLHRSGSTSGRRRLRLVPAEEEGGEEGEEVEEEEEEEGRAPLPPPPRAADDAKEQSAPR